MEPMAVSTKQAGELVGLSQRTIRRYIHAKRIRAVRAGRRVCVPLASLKEFLRVDNHPSAETLRRSEEN